MRGRRNAIRIHTYIKKDLIDWVKQRAESIEEPYNHVFEEAIRLLKEKIENESKSNNENLLGISNKIS